MAIDPVCGMEANESDDVTAEYGETTYYFCSRDCRDFFDAHPDRFVEEPHPHLSGQDDLRVARLPYGRAGGEFDLSIADPESLSVGDSVEFRKSISDDDVVKFAEATGDTNALHLDDTFAEKTRFGGRIVHGTLVSGMISAALACLPGLSIYLSQDLQFEGPVRIGATLTARCEIEADLDGKRYRLTTRVEDSDAKRVIDGTATVLVDPLPT